MRLLLTAFLCLLPLSTMAETISETITINKALVHAGEYLSRPATQINPIAQSLVDGSWVAPLAGSGQDDWRLATADSSGWINNDDLISGHAYAEITVPEDGTWLLNAMGYSSVTINGEPRIGNIYGYTDHWESWQPHFDFAILPVHLKAGRNTFLFHGNRYGTMKAELTKTEQTLQLNPLDTTLPDLVVDEPLDSWGSVVVINATAEVVTNAVLEAEVEGGPKITSVISSLPPFGVRKVGFAMQAPGFDKTGPRILRIKILRDSAQLDSTELTLQVRNPLENRRITFISDIDGSVQYFGYLAATDGAGPKALFLSLHGASVEAINQSGSYAPLNWGHIVAPTNRRPFGFSWEDWGRLDALEVLDHAREQFDIAEDRVYLTGHSMGGHGSWHLASHYPDRFAAVGPSAGWISIWSYRRQPPTASTSALTALIERATLPSQTLEMAPNLASLGVYVLHGADDDNVPPSQAYLMLDRLSEFHKDYVYHEEPGVKHWWDHSDDPGADCVSWPPMFDFFAKHRTPSAAESRSLNFRTASPAISAWHRWVCLGAQQRPFVLSTVKIHRDEEWRQVTGTTENTSLLGLDLSGSRRDSVTIALDGGLLTLAVPTDGQLWLEFGQAWRLANTPDPRHKGPHNNGGFRAAFDHRVQLVYATGGSPEENQWAQAKARYDGEYLWYQGNSSVDVIPDSLFDPTADPDRNVVLYGNASTHGHWQALWTADVTIDRQGIRVGTQKQSGSKLGILAVHPRPGSDVASVGIVGATGPEGYRLMNRRPYLQYGVAYPDVTVFETQNNGETTIGAGFFGNDWSVASGEFAWRADR